MLQQELWSSEKLVDLFLIRKEFIFQDKKSNTLNAMMDQAFNLSFFCMCL